MKCLIAGLGSDIARQLRTRLERDGWEVDGAFGKDLMLPHKEWDLLILAQGKLEPIGMFFDTNPVEWMEGMMVNSLAPLNCLRSVWNNRNPNATVVFLSGPNLSRPTPTYTAYRAGKAALESLLTTLNAEYPETRFKMLNPGVVKTKIHEQTLKAGHTAANYERVFRIMNGVEPTVSHDQVYERLKDLL